MRMKKTVCSIALVLLALLLCLGAVACTEPQEQPPANNNGGDQPSTDTPGDPVDEKLPIDYLPERNWTDSDGPAQFNILQWSANGVDEAGTGWIPWEEGDVEDLDGSMLGEAVYSRNAAIEERYGVEITAEYGQLDINPQFMTVVETNHSSGDDAYQLITMRSNNLSGLITNNYMLDLYDWDEYIHTEMPWWVQDSVESYTLGEHLYMASSEILLRDKGATAIMFFDQQLAIDNEIDDLYELVRNGEWTLNEMLIYAEMAAYDNDGSTMMDSAKDIWGMRGSYDGMCYLYNGIGWKFAAPDEDGQLQAIFGVEAQSILDLQDLILSVAEADWFYSAEQDKATFNPDGEDIIALFSCSMVSSLRARQERSYGLLPMPKLDEDQENYSSLVWMHYDSAVGIPAAVSDPEMCAILLEALSYESYYTVSPVFYDDILLNRGAQDAESKEMLQVVLATRSYDPGQFWGKSNNDLFHIHNGAIGGPYYNGADTISSTWASCKDGFLTSLQDINDIIADRAD